jgi:hypothetical protein
MVRADLALSVITKHVKELDEVRDRHLLWSPDSLRKLGRATACGHEVPLSYVLF